MWCLWACRADLRSTTDPIVVWLVSKPRALAPGVSQQGGANNHAQNPGSQAHREPHPPPHNGLLLPDNPSTPLKVKMEDSALFGGFPGFGGTECRLNAVQDVIGIGASCPPCNLFKTLVNLLVTMDMREDLLLHASLYYCCYYSTL
jgi:hypothetical protein